MTDQQCTHDEWVAQMEMRKKAFIAELNNSVKPRKRWRNLVRILFPNPLHFTWSRIVGVRIGKWFIGGIKGIAVKEAVISSDVAESVTRRPMEEVR